MDVKKLSQILYNKLSKRDMWLTICFGGLLLICWNVMGSNVRLIIAALSGGMSKIIHADSPNWCEQSAYAMVQCHKYGIYTCLPFIILASILYGKYRKWAFICLIVLMVAGVCITEILFER